MISCYDLQTENNNDCCKLHKKKQRNVMAETSERKLEIVNNKELESVQRPTDLSNSQDFEKDDYTIKNNEGLKTPYCAPWLEPDPENFELVADSIEAVRDFLQVFYDEDEDALIQVINSKVR